MSGNRSNPRGTKFREGYPPVPKQDIILQYIHKFFANSSSVLGRLVLVNPSAILAVASTVTLAPVSFVLFVIALPHAEHAILRFLGLFVLLLLSTWWVRVIFTVRCSASLTSAHDTSFACSSLLAHKEALAVWTIEYLWFLGLGFLRRIRQT